MATVKKTASKKVKLHIWNENMLKLMAEVTAQQRISDSEFLNSIGYSIYNLSQIRSGKQNFTHHHLLAAAVTYNRSLDWLYGISKETDINPDPNPLKLIEKGLKLLKAERK